MLDGAALAKLGAALGVLDPGAGAVYRQTMLSRCALPALLAVALSAELSQAEPLPRTSAEFDALVARADKARQEGRIRDAYNDYETAYRFRADATIAGRIALTSSGPPEYKADYLLRAIEGNGGATEAEKAEISDAFRKLRPFVCVLRVDGNAHDAVVSINGSEVQGALGPGFRIIEQPGFLRVRGSSKLYGDAEDSVDCPPGGDADAKLIWGNLSAPKSEPSTQLMIIEAVREALRNQTCPSQPEADGGFTRAVVRGPSGLPRQEDPFTEYNDTKRPRAEDGRKLRGSIGGGPAFVFGVASWTPAVGVMISGDIRPHDHFSIGLDVRAAWVTIALGEKPIQAMTAGGIFSLCLRGQFVFGCAIGHLGIIRAGATSDEYIGDYVFFRPGAGARLGADIPLWERLSLRISAEGLALSSGTRIYADRAVVADVPAALVGANVGAWWNF